MPAVVHRSWQSGQFLAPAPVYLDASITVAWLTSADRLHARATSFVANHLAGNRELQVSLLTVDETIFRVLRGLVAQSLNVPTKRVMLGGEMKRNPQLLKSFAPRLKLAASYMTSWATLVGTDMDATTVLGSWFDRCADVRGLHDAYHLSLVEHASSASFATGDGDFKTIKTLPYPLHIISL